MSTPKILKIDFSGPLADSCHAFIAQKISLGCKYIQESRCLRNFDLFSADFDFHGNTPCLSKALVDAWICRREGERDNNQMFRISVIRQFAKFQTSIGLDAYLYPHCRRVNSYQYNPYIFTADEIGRIFGVSDNLKRRNHSPYYHVTTPVIIRILYGCGLRITEALDLKMKDVDLRSKVLTIRDAKNGQDRLIPMSVSLNEVCDKYISAFRATAADNAYLFIGYKEKNLTEHGFYPRFREVLWLAGIPHQGRGKGPRVHDLRHTFAVHCLNKWVDEGRDIYTVLPILSDYLGHSSISATSHYLRLTPVQFPQIVSIMEQQSGLVFQSASVRESEDQQ